MPYATPRFDDGIPELTPEEWHRQQADYEAKLARNLADGEMRSAAEAEPRRHRRGRIVRRVRDGKIFPTLAAAAQATGVTASSIYKAVVHGYECHGSLWRYAKL
jgi:hypothetical protein